MKEHINAKEWYIVHLTTLSVLSTNVLGSAFLVTCSSNGYKMTTCKVDGLIGSLTVEKKLSKSACIEGQGYGFSGLEIWVKDGCRATFKVIFVEETTTTSQSTAGKTTSAVIYETPIRVITAGFESTSDEPEMKISTEAELTSAVYSIGFRETSTIYESGKSMDRFSSNTPKDETTLEHTVTIEISETQNDFQTKGRTGDIISKSDEISASQPAFIYSTTTQDPIDGRVDNGHDSKTSNLYHFLKKQGFKEADFTLKSIIIGCLMATLCLVLPVILLILSDWNRLRRDVRHRLLHNLADFWKVLNESIRQCVMNFRR